jgi:uncharacterized LabA/DUF88 family protein
VKKLVNNYAFIDSQNLNLGVLDQGWKLDFVRFRVYLEDKFFVNKAFLFIGYIKGNEALYTRLQEDGYICIFKPTLELPNGKVKGNVDAEMVLHTMIEKENFDKAVIVTGDRDFSCLVDYLRREEKLVALVVPNIYKYSGLLKKKDFLPYIRFVTDIENKVKKKVPNEDKTSSGKPFRS